MTSIHVKELTYSYKDSAPAVNDVSFHVKKGEKVITIGGLHGKILEVKETTIIMEVGNQIKLTVEKSAVVMDTADVGQKN